MSEQTTPRTQPPAPSKVPCAHDYRVTNYGGGACVVIYTCDKCNDWYEKDVS